MTDLKKAILDAKYIDMIGLGDFVVRDCGLPDVDADGNLLPQANEIAAAIYRWAADMQAMSEDVKSQPQAAVVGASIAEEVNGDTVSEGVSEYDEHGDPVMDTEEAEQLEAAREAVKEESA
ncbi:hypothetical protein J4E08_19995 [Sagittula sp. NFXS13]|uniref:hypothetical protein n=1 Tax=Sagittula sp. NFXS13 TaxID=2819095 RepID=UPI0032DFF9BE